MQHIARMSHVPKCRERDGQADGVDLYGAQAGFSFGMSIGKFGHMVWM